MKRLIILIIILIGAYTTYRLFGNDTLPKLPIENTPKISELTPPASTDDTPLATIIAENLEVPWGIAFLPASPDASQNRTDGQMLVTERVGRVRLIDSNFKLQEKPILILSEVQSINGEGGLHGIVLHPQFTSNNFVYIYYTYSSGGSQTLNKVERYIFDGQTLTIDKTIIDKIPGSLFHDGGRIKFGPDNFLYITTGDAQQSDLAQNTSSLAGKILRVTDEGKIPDDNPFGNAIYSYGHRNPQGIDWDDENKLWSTEHGRSGALSGLDEVNLIKQGGNYGWPEIQGNETKDGMITPARQSGAKSTWAPACAAVINNRMFFSGLKGEALYETLIDGSQLVGMKEYFKNKYGRIRECIKGPDDMLYITTSNRDGRGNVQDGDDKIIRINPNKL